MTLDLQELFDLTQAAGDVILNPVCPLRLAPLKPIPIPLLPCAVAAVPHPPTAPEGDQSAVEPPHGIQYRVGEQVSHLLPGVSIMHELPASSGRDERTVHQLGYMRSRMYVSLRE
jgi:hypothetical protein